MCEGRKGGAYRSGDGSGGRSATLTIDVGDPVGAGPDQDCLSAHAAQCLPLKKAAGPAFVPLLREPNACSPCYHTTPEWAL